MKRIVAYIDCPICHGNGGYDDLVTNDPYPMYRFVDCDACIDKAIIEGQISEEEVESGKFILDCNSDVYLYERPYTEDWDVEDPVF